MCVVLTQGAGIDTGVHKVPRRAESTGDMIRSRQQPLHQNCFAFAVAHRQNTSRRAMAADPWALFGSDSDDDQATAMVSVAAILITTFTFQLNS